jgi:hypothetical protein
MKIVSNIFILFLAMVVTSCKTKMTMQEFNDHEEKVFSAYCTNNVNAAESVLLTDLQTISGWESNHLEGTDFNIDYNALKARDHERLFLIYRMTQQTNKMEFEFQQSCEYLARSKNSHGESPSSPITPDDIISDLQKLEQSANVQWKTNINFAK